MITVLHPRKDGVYDVVKETEVVVGDSFFYGVNKDNKPQERQIVEIIEQRKERGDYDDESKRRMWAKVRYQTIQQ